MNNPLRILQTLDHHLTARAEITLFGRAALALGYAAPPAAFAATHDVDAILPLAWLADADENLDSPTPACPICRKLRPFSAPLNPKSWRWRSLKDP